MDSKYGSGSKLSSDGSNGGNGSKESSDGGDGNGVHDNDNDGGRIYLYNHRNGHNNS
ncbi:hypothetical protein M3181_20390 [Mesobacillus maritimus]|uniref:hypothetical protein n=1 Tax=Mesobacillus maritimus TaxID=1643336 RepID=UPI00203A3C58|nr:hypothetical protein [Mesobacillus maritimus]MCM3671322.1 hypothetical protein [Mesobacillus maritimus]